MRKKDKTMFQDDPYEPLPGPYEFAFVLSTALSDTMLQSAKLALVCALGELRSFDTFSISHFGDRAKRVIGPVLATEANIQKATELLEAVQPAEIARILYGWADGFDALHGNARHKVIYVISDQNLEPPMKALRPFNVPKRMVQNLEDWTRVGRRDHGIETVWLSFDATLEEREKTHVIGLESPLVDKTPITEEFARRFASPCRLPEPKKDFYYRVMEEEEE